MAFKQDDTHGGSHWNSAEAAGRPQCPADTAGWDVEPPAGMCPGRAGWTGSWDGSVSGSQMQPPGAGTVLPFMSGLHAAPETAPLCDLLSTLLVPSFPLSIFPPAVTPVRRTLLTLGSRSSQASSLNLNNILPYKHVSQQVNFQAH